jgi:hypothetical protein
MLMALERLILASGGHGSMGTSDAEIGRQFYRRHIAAGRRLPGKDPATRLL